MVINCPKCGLSKDLGAVRIPRAGMIATCPRCREIFEVHPARSETWFGRWKFAVLFFAVLLLASALLAFQDWKLDKNYFLGPSTWQGDMSFQGKKYPFVLVIEKARDGNMEGYMDWIGHSPRYRLAIRGTYVGNHLVFEDYAFLERVGATGLHDEQDVYIKGNEMTGTAKNGAATLQALKRESSPL